jgi:hypothetical protein
MTLPGSFFCCVVRRGIIERTGCKGVSRCTSARQGCGGLRSRHSQEENSDFRTSRVELERAIILCHQDLVRTLTVQ